MSRSLTLSFVAGGVLASFGIPTAFALWIDDATTQNAVLAGLLVAIVALILAEHFRYYNRTPKLARLESALENKQTFAYFDRILSHEAAIARVIACAGPGRDFFLQRIAELREASAWADLAAGQVRLSTEEEFPARLSFVRLARHSVVGVSFDESPFWRSPAGQNYLDVQRTEIVERNLHVTRIFVCTAKELHSWRDIFDAQEACGIEVLVLDPKNRLPSDEEDFNVYDSEVVRFAASADPGLPFPSGTRSATFSVRAGDVRRYLTRVESLRSRSSSPKTLTARLQDLD